MTHTPTQTSDQARGYVSAVAGAVFLSLTSIIIRYLTVTYQLPTLILAFWRALFVVITLLIGLRLFRPDLLRYDRSQIKFFVVYGFILSIFNSLWTLSVAINGAAVATVLAYSSVAFTAILGRLLFRESLRTPKMLAVVMSLAGCVLISEAFDPAAWETNLTGILVGTFTGLGYAAYSLMGREASNRGLNPWTSLFYTFVFGTIFLLFYNFAPANILPGTSAQIADFFWLGRAVTGWLALFILAAGPTVGGFGLYNVSLSLLPSSVANLFATLEPVFTAIVAYFLLGEIMNTAQIIGSVFIMCGVIIIRFYTDGRIKKNS